MMSEFGVDETGRGAPCGSDDLVAAAVAPTDTALSISAEHAHALAEAAEERAQQHAHQEVLGRVIGAQEAERARVARDRLDEIGQALRRWTAELLRTEHGCWTLTQPETGELLVDALARTGPDLVVVDDADFPAGRRAALDALRPARVIVVGPEPDAAHRDRALTAGAGGWVGRDHVGDELSAAMRVALRCRHAPCRHADATSPRAPHT